MSARRNRAWLAFANEERCNHYNCLKECGFISWRKDRNNFQIGDIVYLFSSKERKIIFKTVVVGEELRQDSNYWNEKAPEDLTWRLEALEEYTGVLLDENHQKDHGFNGGRSLQYPTYNNPALFSYIKSIF